MDSDVISSSPCGHSSCGTSTERNSLSPGIMATSAGSSFGDSTFHSSNPVVLLPRKTAKKWKSLEIERQTSSTLGARILGDILVACGVTVGVAPFITVVDKAIVQRASGSHTILSSCMNSISTIARNPIGYIKSPMFLLMWGVYASTYSTANCLKTLAEEYDKRCSKEKTTVYQLSSSAEVADGFAKWGIFFGTTLVNIGSSLMKDKAYAQMFGTVGASTKIPVVSYGLWAIRDCMVVGSSFILPEKVGAIFHRHWNLNETDAIRMAQFICPIGMQFAAGPVQLLGLDFYNRPMKDVPFTKMAAARAKLLSQNVVSVVSARIARIAPAYGIGGIGNTYFRNEWRSMLAHEESKKSFEYQRLGRKTYIRRHVTEMV